MWRRRNQRHAGGGVAHARDHLIHLMSGELAAFPRLGSLRDLDLQIVGVDQVVGSDAKTSRGHLLDGTAPPVAVGIALETGLVFPALARIGATADAIHR